MKFHIRMMKKNAENVSGASAEMAYVTRFENAVSMAGGDMVVLVAGSIFLAAAVKELWIKHNQ